MKRQIMKSLMALCAGAMTLCAASSLFTSCDKYDDSLLKQEIESLKGELTDLDGRVKAIEDIKATLEALTAKVDALYTLKFQVVTETNELQYSFDNGTTWKTTGIILAEECDAPCECVPVDPCSCPEVSLVDNGDSVTITVGEAEFTIEKPEEIEFEIKAGKLNFESKGTQQIVIKTSGIEDLTVISTPKGWYAEINADGFLEITAPDSDDTEELYQFDEYGDPVLDENYRPIMLPAKAARSGYVKVHACSTEGNCMVGKLPVEVAMWGLKVSAVRGTYEIVSGFDPYYYGISTTDSYMADIQSLFDAFEANPDAEVDVLIEYGDVSGEIADLLEKDPQAGQEYVVWAVPAPAVMQGKLEEIVLAFYKHIVVTVTEDEAKRSAYDVFVSVDAKGADGYLAMAFPAGGYANADYYIEQILAELSGNGGGIAPMTKAVASTSMAQLHTEPYTGSLYLINKDTQASSAGMSQPNQKCTLLLLPLDERPSDQYSKDDFTVKDFMTNDLAPEGSVNVTATPTDKYLVEDTEKAVDPYTELCIKLDPSAENWKYVYYTWMKPEEFARYTTDGAITDVHTLVSAVLKRENVVYYSKEESNFNGTATLSRQKPEISMVLVAFYVDENDKYGNVSAETYTTKALTKITFEGWLPSTDVASGVLTNKKSLIVTNLKASAEITKYRYILNKNTSAYAVKDDNTWIEDLYFAQLNQYNLYVKEFTPEANWDGTLTLDGLDYGQTYYLVVLPYDKDGNPGDAPFRLKFKTEFKITEVKTTNLVDAPEALFNPAECKNGGYGKNFYWYSERNGAISNFYYQVSCDVTPKANTEVAVAIVDSNNALIKGKTEAEIATNLWTKQYTGGVLLSPSENPAKKTVEVKLTDSKRTAALTPNIYMCWKAGETYYYKTISLTDEFAKYYENLVTETTDAN